MLVASWQGAGLRELWVSSKILQHSCSFLHHLRCQLSENGGGLQACCQVIKHGSQSAPQDEQTLTNAIYGEISSGRVLAVREPFGLSFDVSSLLTRLFKKCSVILQPIILLLLLASYHRTVRG